MSPDLSSFVGAWWDPSSTTGNNGEQLHGDPIRVGKIPPITPTFGYTKEKLRRTMWVRGFTTSAETSLGGVPFFFHFWFGDGVISQPGAIQRGLAGCPLSLRCGVLLLPTGVTRMVPSSLSVEDGLSGWLYTGWGGRRVNIPGRRLVSLGVAAFAFIQSLPWSVIFFCRFHWYLCLEQSSSGDSIHNRHNEAYGGGMGTLYCRGCNHLHVYWPSYSSRRVDFSSSTLFLSVHGTEVGLARDKLLVCYSSWKDV